MDSCQRRAATQGKIVAALVLGRKVIDMTALTGSRALSLAPDE
jgi:hypothetical protein